MSRYLLQLQPGIIYGPIDSRRLGASLGLNILPTGYKYCSFNCIYCQYGFTPAKGYKGRSEQSGDLPSVDEFRSALEAGLKRFPDVAYVTFSGNGEATVHPDFPVMVDIVNELKSRLVPSAKSAILTNSSTVGDSVVREALMKLDCRFMKLDAGDAKTFRRFNRPHKDVRYDDVVAGLKMLDDIIIQALFADGPGGNFSEEHIQAWAEKIAEVGPMECHIYSIDRPTADGKLELVDHKGLQRIAEVAEEISRVRVKVY